MSVIGFIDRMAAPVLATVLMAAMPLAFVGLFIQGA